MLMCFTWCLFMFTRTDLDESVVQNKQQSPTERAAPLQTDVGALETPRTSKVRRGKTRTAHSRLWL